MWGVVGGSPFFFFIAIAAQPAKLLGVNLGLGVVETGAIRYGYTYMHLHLQGGTCSGKQQT
jgi:hypothetical protein